MRFVPEEGASPLFPPQHKSEQSAKEELQHIVSRSPEQLLQPGSRWSLEKIQQVCSWLKELTPSGVWRMLQRLDISLKRGRSYLHSPDASYLAKLVEIVSAFEAAANSSGKIVFLFGDELTFYRQPSLAKDYAIRGAGIGPLARLSHSSDTTARVAAVMNGLNGRVTELTASRVGIKQLVELYKQIRVDYPEAEMIYLVEDNWPVHYHADVLASLTKQQTRFELKVPSNWPKQPSRKAVRLKIPIQILPLPTYASWCNPIEKLWRWLKQEILILLANSKGLT